MQGKKKVRMKAAKNVDAADIETDLEDYWQHMGSRDLLKLFGRLLDLAFESETPSKLVGEIAVHERFFEKMLALCPNAILPRVRFREAVCNSHRSSPVFFSKRQIHNVAEEFRQAVRVCMSVLRTLVSPSEFERATASTSIVAKRSIARLVNKVQVDPNMSPRQCDDESTVSTTLVRTATQGSGEVASGPDEFSFSIFDTILDADVDAVPAAVVTPIHHVTRGISTDSIIPAVVGSSSVVEVAQLTPPSVASSPIALVPIGDVVRAPEPQPKFKFSFSKDLEAKILSDAARAEPMPPGKSAQRNAAPNSAQSSSLA